MPEADLAVRFSKGRGNAESCLRGRGLPCPLIFLAPEPKEQREREALGAGVPSKVVVVAVGKSQEGRKAREHPSRRHFSAEPVFGAPPPAELHRALPRVFCSPEGPNPNASPRIRRWRYYYFFLPFPLSLKPVCPQNTRPACRIAAASTAAGRRAQGGHLPRLRASCLEERLGNKSAASAKSGSGGSSGFPAAGL